MKFECLVQHVQHYCLTQASCSSAGDRMHFSKPFRGRVYVLYNDRMAALQLRQGKTYYSTLGTIFGLRPETITINGER